MNSVTCETDGVEDGILERIRQLAEKALSVAVEVPQIIRYRASLNNEDVAGQKMPQKKPRPKHSPRNNPSLPLVETGNLMDPGRWEIVKQGDYQRMIIYTPPVYHEYLITKDPQKGGRKWLTTDAINPNARKTIEQKMVDKLVE